MKKYFVKANTHQLNSMGYASFGVSNFMSLIQNNVVPASSKQRFNRQSHPLVWRHKNAAGQNNVADKIALQMKHCVIWTARSCYSKTIAEEPNYFADVAEMQKKENCCDLKIKRLQFTSSSTRSNT